ncbi:MAG: SOS response-associated peptidase family protein [Geothrix sp.]|nr:SOS response-associated peptidase family protein [Geothrix sp.]
MCGRVGFRVLKKIFTERFGAGRIDLDAIFPKANVVPTDLVAGVRMDAGQRVASPYLWGFLPPNAPDLSFISKYKAFNAAAETLLERKLWPNPFKTRRCLVVVSAWFEWPKIPGRMLPRVPSCRPRMRSSCSRAFGVHGRIPRRARVGTQPRSSPRAECDDRGSPPSRDAGNHRGGRLGPLVGSRNLDSPPAGPPAAVPG